MSIEISVIVPVYNRENYIGRCLRSLLAQTYSPDNFEIIVINDGSVDDTNKILNAFQNEINVIENKKNLGLPASLNKGIKFSKGKYIVRVDSDDFVNREFLKILHLFVSNNKDISAAACDYFLVDDNEKIIERANCIEKPIGCGILFEKKHLISVGLYDENYLIDEEIELRNRYEKKFSITRVALPLYRYRKHNSNMTNNR